MGDTKSVRFREALKRAIKDRIAASMRLKLMAALTGVISVFMVVGTLFVARMMMQAQYRALEAHGRAMGQFLGRAGTDPLLHKDILTLDSLVTEAAKSEEDMLYTYVMDTSDTIVNGAYASFNRARPDVQAFFTEEKIDDMASLTTRAREKLNPLEVRVDIKVGNTRLGTVTMGYSRRGIQKETRDVVLLLLGTGLLSVAVMAYIVYFMAGKFIVAPTREAVEVASNIAAGDLSQSVRVRSRDELGMLGQGLNRMTLGLKGMIESVREASRKTDAVWRELKRISTEITAGGKGQAESVEEAASSVNEMHFTLKEMAGNVEDLHKTSEQTSSSVIEMAASIKEVAKTTAELSSFIEDTSAAITQMSAAVRQIAEHVGALSTAAEETVASVSEISASVKEVEFNAKESAVLAEAVAADAQQLGMRSIEKTVEGMTRIEATARRTSDVVNHLGERAESIGGILTVIEDITDQTALLALNAAILAAQAGEHGKGFAVVAAEIRELATRTASSTKEIGSLITSVQEETRDAVGVMREEVSLVEEGVRLTREAGDALRKILERADRSRDMSRSINKAAAEQAQGIRHVSDAVEKINEMTHQIARAANEQRTGSEQIMRTSEKMRELNRFVKNSTAEQAKGTKAMTSAVENMTTKIGMVHIAAEEVQVGSNLIVKAIDRIKEIASDNTNLGAGLSVAMDVVAAQTETLKKEIEKFKT